MAESSSTGNSQTASVKANAGTPAQVAGGNELANGLGAAASSENQLSSSQLLTLTRVVLTVLIANIIVGTIMIWCDHEIRVWARVVFSLGVTTALLILACVLVSFMGRIRMEE
jgi:hypothetical protein